MNESEGTDDTFAHAQDGLNLRTVRMLKGPFSLCAAQIKKYE